MRKDPAGLRGEEYFVRNLYGSESDYLAALSLLLTLADVPESAMANAKEGLARRTRDGSLPEGVGRALGWMLSGQAP